MSSDPTAEDLLRELAPQVLAALLRRHNGLDICEDAVQEALLDAATQWPATGPPTNPRAWLITVATRRLIDAVRSESARRAREEKILLGAPPAELLTTGPADETRAERDRDDTLALFLMCCHPALSVPSQIALTLRAIGGLSTAEIASSFFVSEATMAQRISRAKQTIRDSGARFTLPPESELTERLAAVLHVLYLVFNEGYTTSSGSQVRRVELSSEAVRLARVLRQARPWDSEAAGLLALMLLTEARQAARLNDEGDLVDLADQDRRKWNHAMIDEGTSLISDALAQGELGPYQIQAAIAALHDEASRVEDTDWLQILALHDLLNQIAPNPMASLSRAIAAAMAIDPAAGLRVLSEVSSDKRVADHHRFHAVRGQILEMSGDRLAAREAFEQAARLTTSLPEKRYLVRRVQHLDDDRPV